MRLSIISFFILLFSTSQFIEAQQEKFAIQLSGIIRDENNQPVQFATIVVANRYKGTVSDQKGMFSFIVFPNDSVRFSSIGFKTQYLVIPDNLESFHYPVDIKLSYDTIELAEIQIFRYGTYEEFRQAIIDLRIPDDEYQRAMANIALVKSQIYSDIGSDPGANYKYIMQEQNYRSMYQGMLPQQNIFNPFSWAQFIQAIREGRYRK